MVKSPKEWEEEEKEEEKEEEEEEEKAGADPTGGKEMMAWNSPKNIHLKCLRLIQVGVKYRSIAA